MELIIALMILGIPIYSLLSWYYRKETPIVRFQKAFIRTAILVPIIYVIIIFAFIKFSSYYPNRDFTQTEWIKNPERRYELSKNIIEGELLIGKTKLEIKYLLGIPNEYEIDEYRYNLGTVPEFFNMDPDYIIIRFNAEKVVTVNQIRT